MFKDEALKIEGRCLQEVKQEKYACGDISSKLQKARNREVGGRERMKSNAEKANAEVCRDAKNTRQA